MLLLKRTALEALLQRFHDDFDKVCADVLLHGCPQSYMPTSVEGLLEVYEVFVTEQLSSAYSILWRYVEKKVYE